MSALFQLSGSYSVTPVDGSDAAPEVGRTFDERVSLTRQAVGTYDLSGDAAVVVDLGGLTQVNVLIVKAVGGKVTVRLTSADGTTQSVPVDSFLALVDRTVPITAIDLTRTPSNSTRVQVFLGEV